MVLTTLLDNKDFLLTLAEVDRTLRLNVTQRDIDKRVRIEVNSSRFADILLDIMSSVNMRVAQRKYFYRSGYTKRVQYDSRSLKPPKVFDLSKEEHEIIIKNFNLFRDKLIEERKEEYGL